MTNIAKTRLGTSDPINLCKGFYLFAAGNQRALNLGFQSGKTVFAVSPQILAWKFDASAGYNFFMGVCGPAWAVLFQAEGQTSGNQIRLNITNDETEAGLFLGFMIDLFANFGIQQYQIRWITDGWNSRFQGDWYTVLSTTLNVRLDLVDLLLTYILAVIKEQGQKDTLFQKVSVTLPHVASSWGMYDYRKDQFATNGGTLNVDPGFQIP